MKKNKNRLGFKKSNKSNKSKESNKSNESNKNNKSNKNSSYLKMKEIINQV